MNMKIKLWGVRGSLPAPLPPDYMKKKLTSLLENYESYIQQNPKDNKGKPRVESFLAQQSEYVLGGYGGHTTCIQVSTHKTNVIIDCGSGIRRYGDSLMGGPCSLGRGEVHILLTHFHWDHLLGLPFFVPIFIPGNKIHFYAVQEDLEERIRSMFCKPNFPVPFERLGSQIHFHPLAAREPFVLGDLTLTPYQLDHPDPCWGFRFESGGKVFSHCVDTEGIRMSRQDLGPDLPLYSETDLLIFDAQYSFLEASEKVDWGHASAPIGIDLGIREKVKKMVFIHHDPSASDEKIQMIEQQTRDYHQSCLRMAQEQKRELHSLEWCFGREGMVFEL